MSSASFSSPTRREREVTIEADKTLQTGDRITWSYWHSLGRNRVRRTKHGTFIRDGKTKAVVALDGNSTYSHKPYNELEKEVV